MEISKNFKFLEDIMGFFDKRKDKLNLKNNVLMRHLIGGLIAFLLALVFWFAHYE